MGLADARSLKLLTDLNSLKIIMVSVRVMIHQISFGLLTWDPDSSLPHCLKAMSQILVESKVFESELHIQSRSDSAYDLLDVVILLSMVMRSIWLFVHISLGSYLKVIHAMRVSNMKLIFLWKASHQHLTLK